MSRYNPYILSIAIEDFMFEIKNWTNRIREYLQDMRYEFRLVQESVRQMHDVVANVRSETDIDTQTVQDYTQKVTESRTTLDAKNHEINAWEKYIAEVNKNIQDFKSYWNAELSAALTWVSDALRSLQVAEYNLNTARDELYAAEKRLETARDYRDSEGKRQNTSYEENNVRKAQEKYNDAHRKYIEAKNEHNRAIARQNSCQEALNTIALAEQQLVTVDNTLNNVQSSYREADDSQSQSESSMSEATSTNQQEISVTEHAESSVAQASEQTNAGEALLNQTHQDEQLAYSNADGAIRTMDWRIEKLRMLDIPDLGS